MPDYRSMDFHRYYLRIFTAMSLLVLLGCPQNGLNNANCNEEMRNSTSGDAAMATNICRGNVTGAVNGATDPPTQRYCPDCERSFFNRRTSYNRTPHMVSEVANPSCLAPRGNRSDMQALNVRVTGATAAERRSTERFITTVVQLSGREQARRLLGNGSLRVRFHKHLTRRGGSSCLPGRQTDGPIDIARECAPSSTTPNTSFNEHTKLAFMVHEAGHVVGNRGFYQGYFNNVRRCEVSTYCTHRRSINRDGSTRLRRINHRREEFAEVFSAFLYQTDRLRQKCPQAYRYMRDNVFKVPGGRDRYCN